MTKVIPLSQVPSTKVEQLLDAAFGEDRHSRTAYMLRAPETEIADLSFAILEGDRVTGSIQCWPLKLGEAQLVLVGPVAVSPDRQGMGLGKLLMQTMLDAAKLLGNPPMAMIGDPEYYSRFGFVADTTAGWMLPGAWEPRRLLARNIANVLLPQTGMLEPAHAL